VGACLGAGAVFGTVGPKPLVAVAGEGAAAAPDELLVVAPWLALTVSTGFRAHEAPRSEQRQQHRPGHLWPLS